MNVLYKASFRYRACAWSSNMLWYCNIVYVMIKCCVTKLYVVPIFWRAIFWSELSWPSVSFWLLGQHFIHSCKAKWRWLLSADASLGKHGLLHINRYHGRQYGKDDLKYDTHYIDKIFKKCYNLLYILDLYTVIILWYVFIDSKEDIHLNSWLGYNVYMQFPYIYFTLSPTFIHSKALKMHIDWNQVYFAPSDGHVIL